MRAGLLSRRALFQARVEQSDGFGNTVSSWQDAFTRWCHVRYLKGGETVMAARLEGRQPVVLTVRRDPQSEGITHDMRAVIDGRSYNLREDPRPTDDRLWLEMAAESGVADG